jgi:hypothetical protein
LKKSQFDMRLGDPITSFPDRERLPFFLKELPLSQPQVNPGRLAAFFWGCGKCTPLSFQISKKINGAPWAIAANKFSL